MNRYEFLAALHHVVQPRTYLEVGVDDGASLALSRVPSVAIDPAFSVKHEIQTYVHLARTTSDEFFARRDPLARLPRPIVDLAYLDGTHLAEFGLRDFMNVERFAAPASMIVFNNVLPRTPSEATRTRHAGAWTGDVYKTMAALRRLRPDLVTVEVDTQGGGTGVVLAPDPTSTVLRGHYNALVPDLVTADPQVVPERVLHRTGAVDPIDIVQSPIWTQLIHLRDRRRRTSVAEYRSLYATAAWSGLTG